MVDALLAEGELDDACAGSQRLIEDGIDSGPGIPMDAAYLGMSP